MRQQVVAVIDDDPGMLRSIDRLLKVYKFQTAIFASAEAFLDSAEGSGDVRRSRYSLARNVRE